MNVQIEMEKVEKRKNRKKYNIYCLFGTKQSFESFHKQRNRKMSLEQLRKTNQSQTSPINLSQTKKKDINKQRQKEGDDKTELLVKNSEGLQLKCAKCNKLLLEQQYEGRVCCQCVKISKAIQNGNLSKFIRYVIDFKKNKLPSYGQTNKVKRIGSIESCQSLILNKAESSSRHSLIKAKSKNKQSNQIKNSNNQTNRIKIVKISRGSAHKQSNRESIISSIHSGGYFCNQCNLSPILGQRFHCLSCSDYDLCQKCYFYVGHRHQMKVKVDSREEHIKKARENALLQSQKMKKALPLLSQSIQQFQSLPKLYASYKAKRKS